MAKPDWITLSKESGTGNDIVEITVPENKGAYRECEVYVTGSINGVANNTLTKAIKIAQTTTNTRVVKVKVALVSYGYTSLNKCDLVYNIWLESDYTIEGGTIQMTIGFKNPATNAVVGKPLYITQGNTRSNRFSVSYQTPSLYDTSVRLTEDNISRYVTFAAISNGSSNDLDTNAITVEFVPTGILVINNKTVGERTFTIRNEYNENAPLTFDSYGNLIVSWPYRGGLNICSYNCISTTIGNYTKEYRFTLASRTFNTGTSGIKRYYDIWNSIQDEGYYPIKSFKLTIAGSDTRISVKLSDVVYINGSKGVGIISGEDRVGATLNSISTPINAGLFDETGYDRLKFVVEGSSYDNKQICWYHDSPNSNEISNTIIRRLDETLNFNSISFLGSTVKYPVKAMSNEVSATIDSTSVTYTNTEKNMERFYNYEFIAHPNTVL